jgi:hypothetical protein
MKKLTKRPKRRLICGAWKLEKKIKTTIYN